MVRLKIVNPRVVANFMEPRSAVGEFDAASGRYTLNVGSQGVHGLRNLIAEDILKIPPHRSSRRHRRTSAAASAPRASCIANIRWCSKPRSGSGVRCAGWRTAPSISSATRKGATI